VLRFEHIVPAVEVSVEENPAKKKGHMISEEHLQGFFQNRRDDIKIETILNSQTFRHSNL